MPMEALAKFEGIKCEKFAEKTMLKIIKTKQLVRAGVYVEAHALISEVESDLNEFKLQNPNDQVHALLNLEYVLVAKKVFYKEYF